MGWIEDEVDVLVVEVEDEVDREGLGSSSPRFMPLRGPGYGRYKPFSRASHFPTILPGSPTPLFSWVNHTPTVRQPKQVKHCVCGWDLWFVFHVKWWVFSPWPQEDQGLNRPGLGGRNLRVQGTYNMPFLVPLQVEVQQEGERKGLQVDI